MIPVTYNAEDLYLFWYPADREDTVGMQLAMPGIVASTKSGREARPALTETLRLRKYGFTVKLDREEALELDHALRFGQTVERIAVPLWSLDRPTSEFAALPIKAAVNVSYPTDDLGYPLFGDDFEIHAGDAPVGTFANSHTAPLVFCRFRNRPESIEQDTDEYQTFEVSFAEDSDVAEALQVASHTFANGPALSDATTPKVFPLQHDFANPLISAHRLPIDAEIIGQGRRSSIEYFGAANSKEMQLSCYFDTVDEAAGLIDFFRQQGGTSGAFWVPDYLAAARVAQDAAATDTTLEVENASALSPLTWLAISGRNQMVYRKLVGIGGTTLTLDAPLGIDLRSDDSSLCTLTLSRFDKQVLDLSWSSDIDGTSQVAVVETSEEYVLAGGETRGGTIGALPVLCSLYEFEADGTIWYFTSYDRDLTYGAETYVAINITHGDIDKGLYLEDACTVETLYADCEPLRQLFERDRSRMAVRIYRATASGTVASGARRTFTGDCRPPKRVGRRLSAPCQFLGDFLDLPLPKRAFQVPCSHDLYGSGCGLDEADWIFSAVFDDVQTPGWPYAFVIGSLTRDNAAAVPTFGADYFAGGSLWIGDGVGRKSVMIASNTALVSGQMNLTLGGEPDPYPANTDTLKLQPSCDGLRSTCVGRFANGLNFGGQKVALGTLSLVKVTADAGGSKK